MPVNSPLLDAIARDTPGRYLTAEELAALEQEDPLATRRIAAARAAQEREQSVLDATIRPILKKYDFVTGRHGYGPEKCYRDVGATYRYCVFAMLCESPELLDNKLLLWMRKIIQALNFPSGNESIAATYTLLRREAARQLPKDAVTLLDPYFEQVAAILPSEDLK